MMTDMASRFDTADCIKTYKFISHKVLVQSLEAQALDTIHTQAVPDLDEYADEYAAADETRKKDLVNPEDPWKVYLAGIQYLEGITTQEQADQFKSLRQIWLTPGDVACLGTLNFERSTLYASSPTMYCHTAILHM